MFTSFLRYLHAWQRYETTVETLSRLSDRELADLRITRSDIPNVAWVSPLEVLPPRARVRAVN
ncbi:MAG TPA: DUF1127 domain-containing protein [Xanthobacteraceae bacterium]